MRVPRYLPRLLLSGLCLAATTANAYEAGDWILRGGVHYAAPKSDNHDTVDVEGSFGLTGSAEYFLTPHWAVDLLAAVPFEHRIDLKNGDEVARVQHLPPTLSLVWYAPVGQRWHAYAGAGLNYTVFFNERTRGALAGTDLELESSIGPAALLGVDWDLNKRWGLAVDARYLDIDTRAKLDGSSIGTVEIDPLTVGVSVSYRLGH